MRHCCLLHLLPRRLRAVWLGALLATAALGTAQADTGKLLLTSGITTIEGAAGGGISPWALTASYATEGEVGASAAAARVVTGDYALNTLGFAVGINDRWELSLGTQDFDTGPTGAALGLPGLHLRQTIVGAKWRVAGEAILDSDNAVPQIAVGLQHKRADPGGLRPTLDAAQARVSGTDVYVSASKLFLAPAVLVNGTLRLSKANQTGLLGFGSVRNDNYHLLPEFSVAWLLSRGLAVGVEYRAKPDNLNHILGAGVLREQAWADAFVVWAPSKHLSLTAAYVNLGQVAPLSPTARRQTGWFFSAQTAF